MGGCRLCATRRKGAYVLYVLYIGTHRILTYQTRCCVRGGSERVVISSPGLGRSSFICSVSPRAGAGRQMVSHSGKHYLKDEAAGRLCNSKFRWREGWDDDVGWGAEGWQGSGRLWCTLCYSGHSHTHTHARRTHTKSGLEKKWQRKGSNWV